MSPGGASGLASVLGIAKGFGPYAAVLVLGIWVGSDYSNITKSLAEKADRAVVESMASDIRVIRTLVCKDHPGDSMCAVVTVSRQ